MPKVKCCFWACFREMQGLGVIGEVRLRTRSIRMTVGPTETRSPGSCRPKPSVKIFWRIQLIDHLDNYPEKTDRLEQRRRRGKTPCSRGLFCPGRDQSLLTLCSAAIDPLITFSLSSARASSHLFSANTRHRSLDDRAIRDTVTGADGECGDRDGAQRHGVL